MKNKINLPGFSAEACFYKSDTYPSQSARFSDQVATVKPAADNEPSFECSATCLPGQVFCKGKTNCLCCDGECVEMFGGDVKCVTGSSIKKNPFGAINFSPGQYSSIR